MIKVAITGALGRMGSSIIKTVLSQEDMELVAAIEAPGNPKKGEDIGEILGIGRMNVKLSTAEQLKETLRSSIPDVLVDFTIADAAVETAKISAREGINLVIGTTGFSKEQLNEIEDAVRKNSVSAVISPNMATGVNVFFKIAQQMSKILGDSFDVEIIEAHHKHKKDAPSGTAIRVGELIAEATGRNLEEVGVFGRGRGIIGERGKEIAFHSLRGGDIVGDHTVLFAGAGERLELTHRAHSRQAFVNGAIKAIRFVYENKGQGKVFSTWDVLGIK
jgi:4-hydroxy-tetrahydrodipicolinate reductase